MFKSAKINRISTNIVSQIRQAILQGDLKSGDRLPAEKDLAVRFGVSKASLREGYRALEAMGLLEVRQGVSGGAFIREADLQTASDSFFNYIFFQNPSIGEFTQLRDILEPQIAEYAATRITDEDIDDLQANLDDARKHLEEGTFSYDLDIYFHKRIAAIAGNKLIDMVIDAMEHAIVNIKILIEPKDEFCQQVCEAHQRIIDAFKTRDPATVRDEMRRHIQEVGDGLLQCHSGANVFSEAVGKRLK